VVLGQIGRSFVDRIPPPARDACLKFGQSLSGFGSVLRAAITSGRPVGIATPHFAKFLANARVDVQVRRHF
jgi:hypothetical protein